MTDTILVRSFRLLSLKLNPQNEVEFLANAMICCACLSPLFLIGGLLPYGRYSGESTGKLVYIKAKLGWIMQVRLSSTWQHFLIRLQHFLKLK